MGTVTPTLIPGEGYVRVEVNWQDVAHNRRAWIFRTAGGVDTRLRDGDYVWLSNGIAVAFDHEAPLDTPVTYKSTLPLNYNGDFEAGVTEWTDPAFTVGTVTQSLDYYVPGTGNASAKLTPTGNGVCKGVSELIPITADAVNVNPYFETNAADWTGINSAGVSRDTANFHQGVASLLVTPNGVASAPGAQTSEYAVVAGNTYGYSAWLRISSGGTASRDVGIAWYNSSHVFLSASVQTLSPAATVWQLYSGSATAPATATFARLITQGPGVLAAANTWRIDQAVLTDPTTQVPYTLAGSLLLTTYWTLGVGIQLQWYSDGVLISTSGTLGDVTPFPGVWNPYTLPATSAPGANGVRAVFGIAGNAPSYVPVYADELYLTRTGTTVTSGAVMVPSAGGGWWTDPLHPATKVRLQIDLYAAGCNPRAGVAYLGVGEESFPADLNVMDVNDAVYPVAAFQRRKGGRQKMVVGMSTLADLAAVRALHSAGAPLLLQITAAYAEADAYQAHGDVSVTRVNGDQTVEWRLGSSDFTKVLPPVGPAEGTLRTRYADLTKYGTFAAATSAAVTWLDALRGNLAT